MYTQVFSKEIEEELYCNNYISVISDMLLHKLSEWHSTILERVVWKGHCLINLLDLVNVWKIETELYTKYMKSRTRLFTRVVKVS